MFNVGMFAQLTHHVLSVGIVNDTVSVPLEGADVRGVGSTSSVSEPTVMGPQIHQDSLRLDHSDSESLPTYFNQKESEVVSDVAEVETRGVSTIYPLRHGSPEKLETPLFTLGQPVHCGTRFADGCHLCGDSHEECQGDCVFSVRTSSFDRKCIPTKVEKELKRKRSILNVEL